MASSHDHDVPISADEEIITISNVSMLANLFSVIKFC